jgi:oligopeptide/dipeptide ABC transporter ATP-binding protein
MPTSHGRPLLDVAHLRVDIPLDGEVRTVLHDVTFAVRQGEAHGLVGESGSGKSMTAQTIARLLPGGAVASGELRFGGVDVLAFTGQALTEYRRRIGVVFQDPRVHINPVRTVGDFMTETLRILGGVGREEAGTRAANALRDVGIPDGFRRMNQWPHELSGGLLQRVMIATVLLSDPELILADEPTTALDVTTQAEVMSILDELRRERGLAMLFITHDLDLAAAVCDRISVMYAGRIIETLRSELLHTAPRHPYTALLGAARPHVEASEGRLAAIPGRPLSGFEAPDSCAFAARCPHASAQCQVPLPPAPVGVKAMDLCVRSAELEGHLLEGAR